LPEVAQYVENLPGVVLSRDYKYMCSDPGQELIQQDIREHKLDRVVVASCSPLLHEHTFRSATERGGPQPVLLPHGQHPGAQLLGAHDRKEATEKAKALSQAAVQRVAHHKSLETKRVNVHPGRHGGGRRHCRDSRGHDPGQRGQEGLPGRARTLDRRAHGEVRQDLSDTGLRGVHPDAEDVRGGVASEHHALESYSEVTKMDGYVGNYTVQVKHKPRYIVEDACVGCMECIDACVYKTPKFKDDFNEGLGKRKPVYIPFPQATPQVVLIDPERLPVFI
jgi:heterodisulfide reductase subunit A2